MSAGAEQNKVAGGGLDSELRRRIEAFLVERYEGDDLAGEPVDELASESVGKLAEEPAEALAEEPADKLRSPINSYDPRLRQAAIMGRAAHPVGQAPGPRQLRPERPNARFHARSAFSDPRLPRHGGPHFNWFGWGVSLKAFFLRACRLAGAHVLSSRVLPAA